MVTDVLDVWLVFAGYGLVVVVVVHACVAVFVAARVCGGPIQIASAPVPHQ